ncbi:response regulator [Dendronalium sp. ChiSLP03b]|uniref:response regulator n=1 Tax=Dendronalium sp. ChiSLP03b TaxID=3075381 RepID=UPI002AD41BF9|nr:response regulator [Dendronalium sp. ChiSLP03b]MDZ8203606.1 response regulator [Dendronalium sp. ChiSLP03b]
MNQEELNYSFEKIRQQIEALSSYIMQSPMQPQAIAALKTLTASIENLEFLKEEMQASLEVMKVLEEELLQQNESIIAERKVYYDLFKFAPNGYLVTNADGIILEINYTAAALLNVLPSLLIGKSLINFVSQEEHLLFLAKLKESLNIKSVQELEVSICPRDRQAFDALLLVKPGRETSGALGALQICLHDITKYKQLAAPGQMPRLIAPMEQPNGLDGLRVLFVDDEADTRELITAVLMQHGVIVTTVASVTEALSELERSRPDVIISDIRMPDEDGYALIRKIKALEAEKGWQIPTAALTAYLAEDRAKALKAGFQSHLHKLAEPTELIAMVARLSGRA